MSKIIGLNVSFHDTSVAYIKDGEIICVLEEEKLTGIKSVFNINCYPTKCLETLYKLEGVNLKNCDYVAYSNAIKRSFVVENFSDLYQKLFCYSHHKCHNMSSYFTSGMNGKVISLSLDGKGNQSRGKIYLCENGKYEQINSLSIGSTASLATLWFLTTYWLGWTGLKDEGKVVGLAGHGKFCDKIYKIFKNSFYYENFNFGPCESELLFNYQLLNLSKDDFSNPIFRADFAYTLQFFTEEIIKSYLYDISKKYPEYTKICLSGGLFANVKLNKFINELPYFDEIYIHPAMGDSGLALGAALCLANDIGDYKLPKKLNNVFLGDFSTRTDWETELEKYHDKIEIENFDLAKVANLIHMGKIVGLFIGKTEYGPRALGNRSIVVRATDKDTHKKLNERLRRTEIMPFAPSVMAEYFDDIFENPKSKYTSEFMTLCYDTKKDWLEKIPAVVHEIDGSCRPQIVNYESNQKYYNLISEYMKISGIPLVLNTSFNAHGEPINNYPYQVIKHLLDGSVDYIVTEDFILKNK